LISEIELNNIGSEMFSTNIVKAAESNSLRLFCVYQLLNEEFITAAKLTLRIFIFKTS